MTRPRVAIIGGGITGLAAAWELQKQGVDYTLFEAADRLGGKIVTEHVGGFTIEGGPDSFLSGKPWAWQLCDELGLRDQIIGTNDAQRNIYILKGEKLHPYPKGMRLIVPVEDDGLLASKLLSEEGKRRMLAEVELQPYDAPADESLAAFVRRHFGPEALDTFGEPLLAGIHVGDPETMSVRATYPQYVEMERAHGSLIRAMRSAPPVTPDPNAPKTAFFSLRGGTQELVDKLASRLTGNIHAGLGSLDGRLLRDTLQKSTPEFLSAIITTPAGTACELLKETLSGTEFITRLEQLVGTRDSEVFSIGYRKDDVCHDLNGFGFVVPRSESPYVQACTWSSSKLSGRASAEHVLIRVYLQMSFTVRNDRGPAVEDRVELCRNFLQKILGIQNPPILTHARRWHNPQYKVGHLEHLAEIESLCPPGLYLAGSSYRGVGVPDCIHQGRIAAQKATAYLGVTS